MRSLPSSLVSRTFAWLRGISWKIRQLDTKFYQQILVFPRKILLKKYVTEIFRAFFSAIISFLYAISRKIGMLRPILPIFLNFCVTWNGFGILKPCEESVRTIDIFFHLDLREDRKSALFLSNALSNFVGVNENVYF